MQLLHFHRDKAKYPGSGEVIEVQTTDGSSVHMDVSVIGRFFPGDGVSSVGVEQELTHGGPADLIRQLGYTPASWKKTIQRVAVDEIRRALGSLSTSEFYDPNKREGYIDEARRRMNERLAEYGIGVIGVLVRRYTYAEERIDLSLIHISEPTRPC